jgi:hypothetical protein
MMGADWNSADEADYCSSHVSQFRLTGPDAVMEPTDLSSAILLIESDPIVLGRLLREFHAAGIPALGVTTIAHLERWPEGQIVITDLPHFTPWWRLVGAAQVIVLVDAAEHARGAMQHGASGWFLRSDSAVGIAALALPPA